MGFLYGGLFAAGGLDADGTRMKAFFASVPFNFYAVVSIMGTLLFSLGILPKLGTMKTPDRSMYSEFEEIGEQKKDEKKGL